MSTATNLPAFLDELRAQLVARAGLSGVHIFTCPVAPEDLGKEGIEFADEVTIEQSRAALNSTDVEEAFTVKGSLLVYEPLITSIETAAKTARDRAEAILAEVHAELAENDTMTSTVRDVRVSTQTWRQAMAPEGQLGRMCWVEFSLEVTQQFTP